MSLRILPGIVLCSAVLGAGPAWGQPPPPDLKAGKAAYEQSCARCHGLIGKGDGVDAKRFYPRPRDLALGVYKFRSTVSGTPPTDDDLFRTIAHGLPGSNMPDWQHLDEATRWQLVAYLKSLSPLFQQTPPQPVELAADPGPSRADLAKGKAVYEQLKCAACHGATGRANGSSAAGLVDDWGIPIRPANLTQPWTYRGGAEPREVLLRVLAGIDGAGMPSYTGAVSPEDAWQLAYYVASLQEQPRWDRLITAMRAEEVPRAADDLRWENAETTFVRLRNAVEPDGTWAHPATITAIMVQALYNDTGIAFRLTWQDPTQDQSPADALALFLKPEGLHGDVVTLQAWPYEGAPALDVCYWSAQRQHAGETLARTLEQATASASDAPHGLEAQAGFEDGQWHIVLYRPHVPAGLEGAARTAPGAWTSIALSVWDGGNPEARAISRWIDVNVGGTKP
jgi:cytochrome c oxidase cbb3-type subunit 2